MRFTIQTHTEYPDDDHLELPAVDFAPSRKVEGYWTARLIHSASYAEAWGTNHHREELLADIVQAMTKRLLVDEKYAPVDYTLHVYLIPQEDTE